MRNDVWCLVPRPENCNVIGTKWIFKSKIDYQGTITRNKARLVAQGILRLKVLTLMRHLPLLHALNPFVFF